MRKSEKYHQTYTCLYTRRPLLLTSWAPLTPQAGHHQVTIDNHEMQLSSDCERSPDGRKSKASVQYEYKDWHDALGLQK